MNEIDAISMGVLWDRFIAIANETVEALVRTSFSTIARDNYDLACVLFDGNGKLLSQGSMGQPVFIGTGPQTLRHMLDAFPPEKLAPGDVILTNDAWKGTGHVWDINIMRPVFHRTRIVGYVLSISHLPDIGGRGLSAENVEIFEEGLQIPICKLMSGGQLNNELLELIRANVRVSESVIGDIMANVVATEVGGRLLLELLDEYGIEDFLPFSDAIIENSRQAMLESILAIPDGIYRNSVQVEAFEEPVTLACSITVAGNDLSIDFEGTSSQIPYAVNVPLCYTRAMASYAIKCLILPDVPNNEGSVSPIKVAAPEGSILNPTAPSATGARLLVGHFVVPLIFGALAEVMPERVQADPGMMNGLQVTGTDRNGRPFSTIFFASGALGGMKGLDGLSATPAPSTMMTIPAETWETMTGMTMVSRTLRPDSGGPGQWRGGLGQRIELRNDSPLPITVSIMGSRTQFPANGLNGGAPGRARSFEINGKTVHAKRRYSLKTGDILVINDAGGGGYGDPATRDPDALRQDISNGFVSVKAAREDYGMAEI